MFLEWLILTPFLWIPLLVAFVFVQAFLVESDKGIGAGLLLLGILVLLQFGTSLSPFGAIVEHPLYALIGVALYLGVGVFWGTVKWRIWVSDRMAALGESTREYMQHYKAELADPARADFARKQVRESAARDTIGHKQTLPLQVSKSKARITTWMAFWPASMVHFFLWDSIRRFYDWAYRLVAASYQRFSDSAYEKHRSQFNID